jgi:hypothetical protein
LKVPRQCPLVLVVDVRLREGKSVGSEEGKGLGSGLCREQRNKLSRGSTAYDRSFDINVGRAALKRNFNSMSGGLH